MRRQQVSTLMGRRKAYQELAKAHIEKAAQISEGSNTDITN